MRKYRILIAEHDPPAPHRDLREILRSAGHKIADEAKDGLQAVEMAKRIRPDLVIMDIMMPRMDGIAASKRIRRGAMPRCFCWRPPASRTSWSVPRTPGLWRIW